jgi:hypothetical protein
VIDHEERRCCLVRDDFWMAARRQVTDRRGR